MNASLAQSFANRAMELLAPVGSFEALKAAVVCGADAVYLGMERYGARADAGNFNNENFTRALEFAHLRGVKVYVTVNTLIKDSELSDAVRAIKYALQAGADAFIVQDLGLIAELNKRVPEAVLHASTQAGICNAHGAAFAKRLGLSRIVAARETIAEDIATIKQNTGLEIEFFCQGALCVAYSGNCYYSSLVSGCSGNRGKCLQLCRKKYSFSKESGYFLSAKDICLLDKIEKLKSLGVDSLKIEGRLRTPEYVAETVSVYRNALDGKRDANALSRLKKVFNRGDYCSAYFINPTENIIYSKAQNHIGYRVGRVSAVIGGKAKLETNEKLENGDGVKFLRNGIESGGGAIDGNPTGFRGDVKAGDEVRFTSSAALKKNVLSLDARIPASLTLTLKEGNPAVLGMNCKNRSVTVESDINAEKAQNKALDEKEAYNAIGTLGGTDFSLESLNVELSPETFFPASQIKSLRKSAVETMRNDLLKSNRKKPVKRQNLSFPKIDWFEYSEPSVFVQIQSAADLKKIKFDFDYVILNPSDYSDNERIANDCNLLNGEALLNLPFIIRGNDVKTIEKIRALPFLAVVANNISHLELFREKKILGGIGLNRLNHSFSGKFINSLEADYELDGISYAYGKPPLMHFAHCPRKNHGGNCGDCKGYVIPLTDDKGEKLEFRRIKEHYCYGILAPTSPLVNFPSDKNKSILIDLSYASEEEFDAVNKRILDGKPYSLKRMRINPHRKLQ